MTEQEQWEQSLRDKHEGKPKLKVLEGGKIGGKTAVTNDVHYFDAGGVVYEKDKVPVQLNGDEHPNCEPKYPPKVPKKQSWQLDKYIDLMKPEPPPFDPYHAEVMLVDKYGNKKHLGLCKQVEQKLSPYGEHYDFHITTSISSMQNFHFNGPKGAIW